MSLDYPDRKAWLAIRATNRKAIRDRICAVIKTVPPGGHTKDPGLFRSQKRVTRTSVGPGSIHAESEMRGLVTSGKLKEAAKFYERHHNIRGATRLKWGSRWYAQYKRDAA